MNKTLPQLASLALLLAGVSFPAFAAVAPGGAPAPERAAAEDHLQLAQREVEVYFDRQGRRVLVDPYTGEVVAIERPDGRFGRVERVEPRGSERARRYLDRTERRREREVELGRREPPGVEIYPRDDYPTYEAREDEDDGLDRGRVVRVPEPQPEPELEPEPRVLDEPEFAEREPVERAPLAAPSQDDPLAAPSRDAALAAPSDENTGTITIDPPPTGMDQTSPDFATIPQLGTKGASENVARIQIVLDRYGASPGVIDGRMGDNVNNAISAYRDITGEALRTYDKEAVEKLLEESGGPAFMDYTITAVDAAGPYVASVPEDYSKKAELERLGYTSVSEALAERFHMDENYLKALNPGADFSKPGTVIRVANPGEPKTSMVARIVADKSLEQVRAYDDEGRLVGAYPATIGSSDTPSPSGTHEVERIALNPEYTYNPKVNFKQGDNDKILTIPPGPNGPVGTVWIALSKPTYGIHGTPEPSKIGKTNSHGCVRLTNWDAQELAKRVDEGVVVEFAE